MKTNPLIIIGTGLAGYLFAKEFRKLNTATPLQMITMNNGCFYSKPLLSTALTNKKSAAELVIYDVNVMAAQLNATIFTHTRVELIDPVLQTVTTHHQETLAYSQLVLACGSQAIHCPLAGDAVSDVRSVNDIEAYAQYRQWLENKRHIAILGSGLVGCEFANDLINTHHPVDMITLDSYPLAKFVPMGIGEILQKAFAEKGIRWHLHCVAKSVSHEKNRYAISLADQSRVLADGVFSAVGIRATTELAKAAGLQVNRGIVVDRRLQTSIKNIYALGDCAEVMGELRQYIAPIMQCARVLANYLNGGEELVHYEPMPIIVKTSVCPVVAMPPPAEVSSEWCYEINGHDGKALFYDAQKRLRGFALIGAATKERLELTKQLSDLAD